jgi:hypothetical protein
MYEAKAHWSLNYLYIRIDGLLTLPESKAAAAAVLNEARKLQAGFAIVNDITTARANSQEITEIMKRAQATLMKLGARKVIRIVSPASAGAILQFARTQREATATYETHLATSLAEALRLLDDGEPESSEKPAVAR